MNIIAISCNFKERLNKSRIYETLDQNQVTPQDVIDAFPVYKIHPKGAYSRYNCICGLCCSKYKVNDHVLCLPCHHNFHKYCIENWLRWVKPCCPVDKKDVFSHHLQTDLQRQDEKNKEEGTTSDDTENTVDDSVYSIITTQCEINSQPLYEYFDAPLSTNLGEKHASKPLERTEPESQCYKFLESNPELSKEPEVIKEVTINNVNTSAEEVRLKKSVDSIRETILNNKKRSNSKKSQNCDEFTEALDSLIDKFSKSSNCSPKRSTFVFRKSDFADPILETKSVIEYLKSEDSSRRKLDERERVSFGDLLRTKSVRSGWVHINTNRSSDF